MTTAGCIRVFDSQGDAYKQAFQIFLDHTDQKRNAKRWLQQVVDDLPSRNVFIDAGAGNGEITRGFAGAFNRTIASGWGNAETGGWWTVAGSPWNWSVSPGAGNVNVGAGGQELAYLSTFTVQDVDILEKVILPRCSGNSSCNAYVLGRYTPAYSPTYYRVGVVQGAGRPNIFLRAQRNDGSNLASDIDTGLPAADGAAVLLRVEFIGIHPHDQRRLRAYVDQRRQ